MITVRYSVKNLGKVFHQFMISNTVPIRVVEEGGVEGRATVAAYDWLACCWATSSRFSSSFCSTCSSLESNNLPDRAYKDLTISFTDKRSRNQCHILKLQSARFWCKTKLWHIVNMQTCMHGAAHLDIHTCVFGLRRTLLHPVDPHYKCRDTRLRTPPAGEGASESWQTKRTQDVIHINTHLVKKHPSLVSLCLTWPGRRCSSGRTCWVALWRRLCPDASYWTPGWASRCWLLWTFCPHTLTMWETPHLDWSETTWVMRFNINKSLLETFWFFFCKTGFYIVSHLVDFHRDSTGLLYIRNTAEGAGHSMLCPFLNQARFMGRRLLIQRNDLLF